MPRRVPDAGDGPAGNGRGIFVAWDIMTDGIALVAGLGNPDARYAGTRHNIGFDVVDRLARQAGVTWAGAPRGIAAAVAVLPDGCRLIKPMAYMNLSGQAVRAAMDYWRIAPAAVLAVVDDFSLVLGMLRLRAAGSAGGHNGLKSMIEHLGTTEFARLRCGIGPVPPGMDPADFVLGRFVRDEEPVVEDMLSRAAAVVNDVLREGMEKTASRGLNG